MSAFTLGKEIKIRNVSALWKELIEMEGDREIDCSALEKVDGAGFQLLLYLNGLGYSLKGLSEEMVSSFQSKGFNIKGVEEG